jgi:hypothetical protein
MMLPQELEILERAYGLGQVLAEAAKPEKAPVKTAAPTPKKPRARARA